MGRFLSTATAALAVTPGTEGIGTLAAASAVAVNDAILVGPTGKGQKVGVTNYAAVAAVGQITAQTQVYTNRITKGKNAALQLDDGSFLVAAPNALANGLRMYRYAPEGLALGSLAIDAGAFPPINPQIQRLSNGNIAVFYLLNADLKFAVFTQQLAVVVAATVIEASTEPPAGTQYSQNVNFFGAVAYAGGFMVVYQGATASQERAAWYTNAGAVAVAAKTIETWTGAGGSVFTDARLLSNGNIAIAVYSQWATKVGTYHAIYDTAGNQVKAFTQLAGASVPGNTFVTPELSVLAGYYAIATINDNTNVKVWVLDNAGTLQGAVYTTAGATNGARACRLVNDGANFYAVGPFDGTGVINVLTVPVTGGAGAVMRNSGLSPTNYVTMDAACDGLLIVMVFAHSGTTLNQWATIDLVTGYYLTALTDLGVAPATSNNGLGPHILLGGDCAFVFIYDYTTTEALNFWIGKYAATAIAGVALTDAVAGATMTLATASGAHQTNYTKGAPAKNFDHSSSVVVQGNRGSIQQYSLVLRGI